MRSRAQVFLATCADSPSGGADTARLASRLRDMGLGVSVAAWDDPGIPWDDASLVVIRSVWDYHLARGRFLRWARAIPSIQNPYRVVEWNTDKRYLLDLAVRVPVIPTRVLADPAWAQVERALDDLDVEEGVVKPAVGLDGRGVRRVQRGTPDERGRTGHWLVQPLLPEAASEGEISLVFIEGVHIHSVLRRPPRHDSRAQERLGGRVEPTQAPADFLRLARRVVEGLDPLPLYARVDLVSTLGTPCVMELELVDPSLFLTFSDQALDTLAAAIQRRVDVAGHSAGGS